MELNNLPVIDDELGIKLAGNKKELANELLCLFMKNLNEEISSINELYTIKNYPELIRRIHRLHGAVCYCGLPRLKSVITQLETELKSNIMSNLPLLFNQLNAETTLLFEHYSRLQDACTSNEVG